MVAEDGTRKETEVHTKDTKEVPTKGTRAEWEFSMKPAFFGVVFAGLKACSTRAAGEYRGTVRILFTGNQGMRDGMYRQCDAVLHPDLAHQFGYVGLYRALFDAERCADLVPELLFRGP